MSGNLNQIIGDGIKELEVGGVKVTWAAVEVRINPEENNNINFSREKRILSKGGKIAESFGYRVDKTIENKKVPGMYHLRIRPKE